MPLPPKRPGQRQFEFPRDAMAPVQAARHALPGEPAQLPVLLPPRLTGNEASLCSLSRSALQGKGFDRRRTDTARPRQPAPCLTPAISRLRAATRSVRRGPPARLGSVHRADGQSVRCGWVRPGGTVRARARTRAGRGSVMPPDTALRERIPLSQRVVR